MNFLSLFGIAPNDRRNTMLLIGNNFFEGLAIALFYSVALSSFLDNNPIYRYGWLMIASGAFVMLFTVFFEKAEHHLPPEKLFRLLAICSICVFALGFGLMYFEGKEYAPAVGFALMVLYHFVYFLYKMRFWGLSAMFFDVRQSKRMFGLISSVYLPAKFIGYTLVTTLGVFSDLGYPALLLLGVLSYLVSFGFMQRLTKRNREVLQLHHHGHDHAAEHSKSIVNGILRLSFIMVFTLTLINFLFAKEVQHHFEEADGDMFRLISEALAISYGLAAVVKIVASGRILTRFKLKNLLMITPILLAVSILAHLVIRTVMEIHEQEYLFFVMLMIGSLMLSEAIDQPLVMSLFQPLGKREILSGHTKVKGYGESVGVIVIGLLLIFLYGGHKHINLKVAIPLVLGATLLWVAASWVFAGRYLVSLRHLIDLKLITGSRSLFLDQSTEQQLLHHLESDDIRVVEHTAIILEENRRMPSERIGYLLNHESQHLRLIVLQLLSRREKLSKTIGNSLIERLSVATGLEKEKIIELLCRFGSEQYVSALIREASEADHPHIARGLAANKRGFDKSWLLEYAGRKMQSDLPADQLEVLCLADDHQHEAYLPFLKKCLLSVHVPVIHKAIETSARYSREAGDQLLALLQQPTLRRTVLRSLSHLPVSAVIELHLENKISDMDYQQLILLNQDEAIPQMLCEMLDESTGTPRNRLLRGMIDRGGVKIGRSQLLENMDRERKLLQSLQFDVSDNDILDRAITLEQNECVERMLGLCYLHTGEKVLLNAQKELFLHGENKLSLCIEALQVSLPGKIFMSIRDVLEGKQDKMVLTAGDLAERLKGIKSQLSTWMQLLLSTVENKEETMKTSGQSQSINSIDRVMLLKTSALFEEIRDNRLLDIADHMQEVSVNADTYVFKKGDPGDSLYIITGGEVAIIDEGHELTRFSKGDFFGDLSLLDPAPRSASAKATQPTGLLKLDETAIYELMHDHIEVVKGVLSALCKRIRNQNRLYVEEKNKVSHQV